MSFGTTPPPADPWGGPPGQDPWSTGPAGGASDPWGRQVGQSLPTPAPPPAPFPQPAYQPTAYPAPHAASYVAAPRIPTPPAEPKSGALGVVSLIISLLCTAGALWLGYWAASAIVAYSRLPYSQQGDASASMTWGWTMFGILSAFGLASFVMGIIATATGRGRASGIGAIVLATLAPVLGFLIFLVVGIGSTG